MKSRFVAALAATLLMAAPQLVQAQSMDIVKIIGGIGGSEFLHDAGRADSAAGLRVVRLSSLAGAEMNAGLLARALEEVYGVRAQEVKEGRRVVLTEAWGRVMAGTVMGVKPAAAIFVSAHCISAPSSRARRPLRQ